MKKAIKTSLSLFLVCFIILSALSCAKEIDTDKLWENAKYTSDTVIGSGANTLKLTVTAGKKSVILTVKTDKLTLGEALFENGITNDPSFFDTCNQIKADWEKDKAYWSFYVGEELAMYGIGDEKAVTSGNPEYKIVYTK